VIRNERFEVYLTVDSGETDVTHACSKIVCFCKEVQCAGIGCDGRTLQDEDRAIPRRRMVCFFEYF
jgi:hypothetical protein